MIFVAPLINRIAFNYKEEKNESKIYFILSIFLHFIYIWFLKTTSSFSLADPTLLRQWCQTLRLTDTQRYLGKHICSMHLPMNKTLSCIICGGDNVELPILGFPENRNQRAKWCYNLKIDAIPKWDHSKHICSRHFESYCFDKPGELRPGAAPTLHLNHDDTNIFFSDYSTGIPSSPIRNRIKDETLESESDEMLLV